MKKVNERIRELREQMHLSQDYVAKYLGMNRSSYTQLENENRKIMADDISKLCILFGVSADTLLGENEEVEAPVTMFARSFANLSETDQAEIMNLIRFKQQIKAQRSKGLVFSKRQSVFVILRKWLQRILRSTMGTER